jgi:uncharacterized membrane protein (DUF2068 family)
MKRSRWIIAVTAIQALLALTMIGGGVYLLLLTRSPEITSEKDAADTVMGLRIAAGFCFPIGLMYVASAAGLWKRRAWGWWLGVLLSIAAAISLGYSVVDDGWRNSDSADIGLPILFVLLTGLFLVPAVRNEYRRQTNSASSEVSIPGSTV